MGAGKDTCRYGGVRVGGQSIPKERSGNSPAHATPWSEGRFGGGNQGGAAGTAGSTGVQRRDGRAEERGRDGGKSTEV